MSKKLTILFAPVDGVGHVNACIGLAEALQSRGHKIVFMVGSSYKGKLSPYGFTEELLENPIDKNNNNTKPGEHGADSLAKTGLLSYMTSLESLKVMASSNIFDEMVDLTIQLEPQVKEVLERHRPDLYIIDNFIGSPQLIYSDKPWVFLFSGNPLFVLYDERTPPGASGFPANGDNNSKEWKEFRELSENLFDENTNKYNKWLKDNGFPTIQQKRCIPDSPYLNLYGYPEELDYTDLRPLPDKWSRVDSFARKGEQEFAVPEKVKNWIENKDKIIYLSLGSMGSINIELMQRLVQILSKSSHKFIVSKGLLGDKYELSDNMWGQNSVPQTKVLPLVDLVITHGGNNTITETFSCGKPMIVMPLFADQFDNSQRVHEKGFGIRMSAHKCTEEELLGGIEKLLNDNYLKNRLNVASKRMANSNSLIKASELIEKLIV